MQWASSTLTSFSVHFIQTMFGIQLTGHCAAKGQRGSGSVINYKQISSYKDPSPLEHHFSWRLVNLINQQLSPHNHQPASLYFMARFIHFLHVSSVLQCRSLQKQRWMFDNGRGKKSQRVPFRVVSPPLFLLSHSFTVIFIFCLFLLSCMHNTLLPLTEEGAAESHVPEPCILQRQGDSPASFSIPTWWHFSLCSINQTPRPAELKERNNALEENSLLKKRLFQRKC